MEHNTFMPASSTYVGADLGIVREGNFSSSQSRPAIAVLSFIVKGQDCISTEHAHWDWGGSQFVFEKCCYVWRGQIKQVMNQLSCIIGAFSQGEGFLRTPPKSVCDMQLSNLSRLLQLNTAMARQLHQHPSQQVIERAFLHYHHCQHPSQQVIERAFLHYHHHIHYFSTRRQKSVLCLVNC